jgi:sporulation protein YlmC with PRC-barrel domain
MKAMKLLIASTAMALVLAGPMAWAASGADTLGAGNLPASSPAAGNASQTPDQGVIHVVPANQIVGRALKDAQGIDAGKINSLVIDTKTGAVEFVMITPPSSLNADKQLIAAPWAVLDPPATADGPITLKLSLDKLAQAPRIDPRLVYEMGMQEMRNRMYGYYGVDFPGYPKIGTDNPMAATGKNRENALGARDRQIDLANQLGPKPPSVTSKEPPAGSSALIFTENGVIARLEALKTTSTAAMYDSTIYDSKGKDIGAFDQTMIDVARGQVAYILVSHGGFLGMDENLYVVPIEALALSPYRGDYRLTVNAQVLAHEPALHVERGNLPSHISAAQLAMLYHRFGVQPYWTQAGQQSAKLLQPKRE